jgi:hypothetical protein
MNTHVTLTPDSQYLVDYHSHGFEKACRFFGEAARNPLRLFPRKRRLGPWMSQGTEHEQLEANKGQNNIDVDGVSTPSDDNEMPKERQGTSQSDDDEEKKALERLGPPNLQLNHSRPYDTKEESRDRTFTFFVVVVAVILQLGMIAIAGVTAYYTKTRSAVDYDFVSYGFPCYTAGSFCLSLGMGICAFVIGQSTTEWSWDQEKDCKKPLRLFWVQKAQSVSDQTFGPYAIVEGPRRRIVSSSRCDRGDYLKNHETQKQNVHETQKPNVHETQKPNVHETQKPNVHETQKQNVHFGLLRVYVWEILSMFGVFMAACGFCIQFIGLRALPYPVAIAHLGGIILMALLRARTRSNMSREIHSFPTLPKYELDFLATKIVFDQDFREGDLRGGKYMRVDDGLVKYHWRVVMADGDCKGPNEGEVKEGDKKDAREVTPNEGKVKEEGDKKDAREVTPNKGEDNKEGDKKDAREVTSQQLLRVRQRLAYITTWQSPAFNAALALSRSIVYFLEEFYPKPETTIFLNLDIPVTRAPLHRGSNHTESVYVRFLWQDKKGWEADQAALDAIISLWMAHVESACPPGSQVSAAGADGSGAKLAGWFGPDGKNPIYRFRRILGNDNGNDAVLNRDLHWWVDGFNDQMLTEKSRSKSDKTSVKTDSKLVIGFKGRAGDSPPPPSNKKSGNLRNYGD